MCSMRLVDGTGDGTGFRTQRLPSMYDATTTMITEGWTDKELEKFSSPIETDRQATLVSTILFRYMQGPNPDYRQRARFLCETLISCDLLFQNTVSAFLCKGFDCENPTDEELHLSLVAMLVPPRPRDKEMGNLIPKMHQALKKLSPYDEKALRWAEYLIPHFTPIEVQRWNVVAWDRLQIAKESLFALAMFQLAIGAKHDSTVKVAFEAAKHGCTLVEDPVVRNIAFKLLQFLVENGEKQSEIAAFAATLLPTQTECALNLFTGLIKHGHVLELPIIAEAAFEAAKHGCTLVEDPVVRNIAFKLLRFLVENGEKQSEIAAFATNLLPIQTEGALDLFTGLIKHGHRLEPLVLVRAKSYALTLQHEQFLMLLRDQGEL